MIPIAIIYGSSTGSTEAVAKLLASKLLGAQVELVDVSKASASTLEKYPNLILGTSTWGLGDLQDDWETFLPILKNANLDGKTVALFGLGDAQGYPDTFVDGIGIIHEAIEGKGINLIGLTGKEGYDFLGSKALRNDSFLGLVIDVDNEDHLTHSRVEAWAGSILGLMLNPNK